VTAITRLPSQLDSPVSVADGLAAVGVRDLASDVRRGLQEQDAVDDVADPARARPNGAAGRRGLGAARTRGLGGEDI
jgi:hypothetical protein